MPWIKAWHVIFMVTWFAGLFYLPRLFVYHASTTDSAGARRFCTMEARLFVIMTIGAILTTVFGIWLIARSPRHGERWYRLFNEVPTLLLIGIVLLAVARPF
jgi:putative membrane protein